MTEDRTTQSTETEAPSAPESAADVTDAPAGTETATDATEGTEDSADKGKGSEAKLRKRAQAAEVERDNLAANVDALRRQLAAASLVDVLAKPEALWTTAGASVADYFAEDGSLEVDKLREAGKAAISEHGLGAAKRFHGSGDGGPRGEAVPASKPDPFAEAGAAIRNAG